MSDGQESSPPTQGRRPRPKGKYERPAVIWVENLNLGSSQPPICQKVSGQDPACTAVPNS